METVNFVYNGANQIACQDGNANGACGDVGDVPYEYDAYGNLTGDGAHTYTYDAENRLTSVSDGTTMTTYSYNGDGDRVSQTVGGIATNYVLDTATPLTMVLAETTGTETIYYLHGLDLVAQSDGVSTEYFGYDGLGSVRQVLDSAGEVLLAQVFDPYGNPYASAGVDSTNFGYTGEQTDQNGLIFLRARYYDPWQGRFFIRDPFSGSVDYPATLNPYLYGLGNPILHTDPSGQNPLVVALLPALIGVSATFATGAIAGGIYGYATYEWARAGECGCDIQQQALSMTRMEWAGAHALSGGIIAGIASAMAATGPVGLIMVGSFGVAVSGTDLIDTVNTIRTETGFTACTLTRTFLDVATAVFSVIGIREGVRAWRASGSGLGWAPPLYLNDFRGLYGASADEIREIIPSNYEVIYKPYKTSSGRIVEQWVFRSPNGIEEVRIHVPMNDPDGPWQVRWGIKDVGQIPSQYRSFLAPPNQFDPNYWLYFDRYGQPQRFDSPSVHELFTVKVTFENMVKVFGKP